MRRIRVAIPALITVVALIGAACGSGKGTSAGGGAGDQAAAGPSKVAVTLSDFKIEPSQIEVIAGRPADFSVTNEGPSPHTFAVKVGDKTYDTGEIQANATLDLSVPSLAAGAYDALCTVPGHDKLGMTATVNAGSGGSSGAATDTGGSMPGMSSGTLTAQQMADMHKEGVDAFLAGSQTSTIGGQILKPTMQNGVKVFNLVAQNIRWEVSKGKFVDAMAFNGTVPGPELHVTYGDKVKIVVQNQMDQPTVLHLHGMTVPNAMDGVPYVTQDPIMPGQYWTYEFTVKDPPGMYVYHSHFNSTEQVGAGMYGAVIVDPPGHAWPYRSSTVNPRTGAMTLGPSPRIDDDYTMFLGDGPLGYVLNGKSFPATAPLSAKRGDWVLIHIANDGSLLHPMHLHGYHFEVVAQDGYPLASPYMADTLVVAPGQRFDILIHAVYPGAWAFHCHILPHVEGPEGMYGMVTALVVT
jgi:FtsP/CotA-like multicopper oxidase with cupredoxin domain